MFVFDTWFYLTHHILHIQWFMDNVHRHHHVIISIYLAIYRTNCFWTGCCPSFWVYTTGTHGTFHVHIPLSNESYGNVNNRFPNKYLCFVGTWRQNTRLKQSYQTSSLPYLQLRPLLGFLGLRLWHTLLKIKTSSRVYPIVGIGSEEEWRAPEW
jgi:hypothetical protein